MDVATDLDKRRGFVVDDAVAVVATSSSQFSAKRPRGSKGTWACVSTDPRWNRAIPSGSRG